MLLSVIIPHYGQEHLLLKCLAALEQQTLPKDLYEVIVVHNEPIFPRELYEALSKLQELALLPLLEPVAGSYAARNTGIAAANGEYLVFTDSDCQPTASWLEELVSYVSANSEVDRVAGEIIIEPPLNKTFDWCFQYERIFGFRQKRSVKAGTAVTANLLVKKSLFDSIGLFDAKLRSGGDKSWNARATNAGFSIEFCPAARVRHPSRDGLSELCRKHRRTYGGWFLLYGWNKLPLLARLALVVYPLRPPIRPFSELCRSSPTVKVFLKVSCIIVILRLARVCEHLRLSVGALPLR